MPSATRHPALQPVLPAMLVVVLVHGLLGGAVWALLPLWKPVRFGPGAKPPVEDGRYWFAPTDYQRVTQDVPAPASESSRRAGVPALPSAMPAPAVAAAPDAAPLVRPGPAEMHGTLAETSLAGTPGPASAKTRPTSKSLTLSPVLDLDPKAAPFAKITRPPLTMMEMLKQDQQHEAERKAVGGADMDPVLRALEKALGQAWNAPPVQDVAVLQRDARLQVSIGRDGTVLESKLTKASGSSLLDGSVSLAAEGVKKISESLPSSFPKDRYTVEVNFHIE